MKRSLKEMRALLDGATPGPWEMTGNYPFYIEVKKPAPSLSKHDETRPTYWRYEDGAFIAAAPSMVADLLDTVEKLREALRDVTRWAAVAADMLHDVGHPTNGCAILEASMVLAKLDAAGGGDAGGEG